MREAFGIVLAVLLLATLGACDQGPAPAREQPVGALDRHEEGGPGVHAGEEHGHSEQEGDHQEEPPGFVPMQEAKRLGPMETRSVQWQTLTGEVEATGEVRSNPDRVAHLTSRVSGWIQEIYAFEEDAVRKGEILALIDSPEYLTAQTEYLMALRRSESPKPREDLQTAQALLASSRQKLLIMGAWEEDIGTLSRMRTPQRFLPLRAPISGTVIESRIVRGTRINAGDDLYRIADLSEVWVILDIFERDLMRVTTGSKVWITTVAYPGESFVGTLTRLSQTAREATRTVQARVVLRNPLGKLRPGLFVSGRIEAGRRERVLAVPEEAVFLFQGRETVFVQREAGYEAVPVRTGRRQGGWVEILEGLSEDTAVVVKGGFSLKALLMKEQLGEGHVH